MDTEYEVQILETDVEGIYADYGYDLPKIYELKLEEERK